MPTRSLVACAAVLCFPLATTSRSAEGPAEGGIEVDRDRAEIRFPCLFVNPTRTLEVFACHRSGPTHETVLEFDVRGPAIYRALKAIGCRDASYWNGTSPDDFLRNQGDRLLVVVRWTYAGKTHEHPAEGLLVDGESEFPMFVRGFSFGARDAVKAAAALAGRGEGGPPAGGEDLPADVKETGIPVAVEVTLGGTNRQAQVHSLLWHPTSSPRVQRWTMPPYLDPRVVEEHQKLVEEAVPATLIIRRVPSEAKLLETARSVSLRRGLDESGALYDRVEPIAREIDALKAEYESLLGEIRSMLEGSAGKAPAGDPEKAALAEKGKLLLWKGRSLSSRIEERYLTIYGLEEEFKARWAQSRKDLAQEVRDDIEVLVRSGFRFEPLIAAKQLEEVALADPRSTLPPGDVNIRTRLVEKEVEVLELERGSAIALANQRYAEGKHKEAREKEPYLSRLFEEDARRTRVEAKRYDGRLRVARTEVAELKGLLDGTWDKVKDEVLKERDEARKVLQCADIEDEVLSADEEIRWTEGDRESDDPKRKADAVGKLADLAKRREAALKRLKEAGCP